MRARTRFVGHPRFGYDRTLRRLTTRNDTAYILSSTAMTRRLDRALEDMRAGRGVVFENADEFLAAFGQAR
jgi:hypothetical protein